MANTYRFSGGEKLEKYLKMLAVKAKNSAVLNVGFLEGSTEEDGTPTPMIAALNEFGVPSHNQPPRPFFRRMIKKESPHWGEDVGKQLVEHEYDAVAALIAQGREMEGELVQSINDLWEPKLADSTIKHKGFNKPLIDSGSMVAGVDSFVTEIE